MEPLAGGATPHGVRHPLRGARSGCAAIPVVGLFLRFPCFCNHVKLRFRSPAFFESSASPIIIATNMAEVLHFFAEEANRRRERSGDTRLD